MHWYLKVLKNYATFSGRAQRKEFLIFTLFVVIFSVLLGIIDSVLGFNFNEIGILNTVFLFLMLVPSLAVTVRRLHDTNRSGWWLFISLVPIVGGLILIYWEVKNGDVGENRFGPDPKGFVEEREIDVKEMDTDSSVE